MIRVYRRFCVKGFASIELLLVGLCVCSLKVCDMGFCYGMDLVVFGCELCMLSAGLFTCIVRIWVI